MDISVKYRDSKATIKVVSSCMATFMAFVALAPTAVNATENSAGVYPAGVKTIMPGMTPPPDVSMFEELTTTYQANQLLGANGQSLVPGFHLTVYAIASEVVHHEGVHLLGGTLVRADPLPVLYERLRIPSATGQKTGFGNPEIVLACLACEIGTQNWWPGLDIYTPGFSFHKNDLVRIGQHYLGTAPVGAFTYLPNQDRTENGSSLQYGLIRLTQPQIIILGTGSQGITLRCKA
jgi:hypothetical protein